MRPESIKIGLALLLPLAFVAGRLTTAQDPAAQVRRGTVRAQRYRVFYAASALDAAHDAGEWVEELYFPKQKVACFQVWDYPPVEEWKKGKWPAPRPRLTAMTGQDRPRNDLTGFRPRPPSAIEEVQVPAKLAREIFGLAKLRERHEREALRLGRATVENNLLRQVPREEGAKPTNKKKRE